MKTTTKLLVLLQIITLGFSTNSLMELYKSSKAKSEKTNQSSFIEKITHRKDVVFFTGQGLHTKINIASDIIQTDEGHLGNVLLHTEVFNAENDSLIGYYENLYLDEGRLTHFTRKNIRGEVDLSIPFLWDFPIYVNTWITNFIF